MAPNSFLSPEPTEQITQNQQDPQIYSNYTTLWGYFKTPLVWTNVVPLLVGNLFPFYFFLPFPFYNIYQWKTFCWAFVFGWASGLGVTAGAHRLWSHKAYKARLPLKIILLILFAMSGQNTLYDWVRNHRVHHKFSETDADPHNINRGVFFSHFGWLMMKKHPEVLKKGRQVDCSDILEDPLVMFLEKYYVPIMLFSCFIFPTMIPYYCWNETLYWSVVVCIARYFIYLNCAWLINSAAHRLGNRPYNKDINPADNMLVDFWSLGEGYHNYHHTFPWDYKSPELGCYGYNPTTLFIKVCAKLGLAYDLKSPSKDLVRKTILMKGDGSLKVY